MMLVKTHFSAVVSAAVTLCSISVVELSTAFGFGPTHHLVHAPESSCPGAPRTLSRERIKLYSSSESNSAESPNKKKQPRLSASQQERRNEDQRRKERQTQGFATPGLSSAKPGAQDYAIDIAKTEREYIQSLGSSDDDSIIDERNADKYVALWTEEGLAHLRMLHFQEASDVFRKVYQIKPEAYLWQDGLLKYYLEDYHAAAESLAQNAIRYETRFMEPASEERIWRDAAELKIVNSLNGGRKMKKDSNIPMAMRVKIEEKEGVVNEELSEKENIGSERRKVMRLARQLFSSSLRDNTAGMALAKAQLQALCGGSFPSSLKSTLPTMPDESDAQQLPKSTFNSPDRKMYKLHSLFYLGLHYDALGQSYESKQCMKMALKTCANSISGNNQDITYLLPVIHMTIRDWYDDDEFEEKEEEDNEDGEFDPAGDNDELIANLVSGGGVELEFGEGQNSANSATATASSKPKTTETSKEERIEKRLRESIKDMRLVDLKGELKKRVLKVSGSKQVLRDRLIEDLKKDACSV